MLSVLRWCAIHLRFSVVVDSIGSDIHNRDLRQIDLFAEQLDLTAALVRAGGLARGRIALVAIDNLAEVLLYRHLQFTFGASEEMGRLTAQRYDRRARERLRQDFDRRVTLAATEHTGTFSWSYPKPILDRVDATIFRVAHRYRNGVYHEDRHNAALLDPLTRLYLAAVGRAWCRAQPEVSMGGNERQLRGLNYISRHAQAGGLALPHAVVALSSELLGGLEVAPRTLATRLAADLERRAAGTDEARRKLVRRGLVASAHADMLRAAELRYVHRADPELVRLQEEASEVLGQLVAQPDDAPAEDLQERFVAAENGQRERIDALRADFRPKLSLGTAASIRKSAKQLREVRDIDRLLSRYEARDERLRLLESCLAWLDRSWDQMVTHEEEVARGK